MKPALLAKAVVQIVAMPLPWLMRRPILNLLPGFSLAKGSRLGLCLLLAERVILERGASIGHFTIVSPLGLLRLGPNAEIGRGNRIVGAQRTPLYRREPDRQSALLMGEHASITRNHLVDCANTVEIGPFTILAGWGTQILTHAPDFAKSRQTSAPVVIGAYCFVGTRSILLKGARLPDRSILAAGSAVTGELDGELQVYAGSPAKAVKAIDPGDAYFRRPYGRMLREWEDGCEIFGG